MDLQVAKWGNSLALRLPVELVHRFGLRAGDTLNAQITPDGALNVRSAQWDRSAFAAELAQAREALPLGASVIEALRRGARY